VFFVPPDTFEQSQLIPITWFVSDQRKQLLDLAGGMHRQANLTITARAGAYITSNRNSTISAVLRRANAFCNATPLFSITTLVAVTTAVAGMTGRRGDSQRGARNKEQAKKLLHDDLHTNHWRVSIANSRYSFKGSQNTRSLVQRGASEVIGPQPQIAPKKQWAASLWQSGVRCR
jgi:hypothetical protein